MSTTHIPVLGTEVIEGLNVQSGKRYIDATVGGGGHGVEIVRRGGILLGIDTDPAAVNIAKETLKKEAGTQWKVVQGNFRDIENVAKQENFEKVSGVLFDLGISSMQLDTPDRGFSYRFTDAALDLRMNQSEGETAAQLVNRMTESEMYDVFSTYGEEQLARSIAHAVYHTRSVARIETVGDLVRIVETVKSGKKESYAVLSRIFQALRIVVNEEMTSLKKGLIGAGNIIQEGGRLVVISFHSLEDRIVKRFMRGSEWDVITKHPIVPSPGETYRNRRSHSAKLRIATKKRI